MKPEQFIREFGMKKARDLLDQREKFIHVEKPTHFDTDLEIFIHEADFRTGKLDESDIRLSDLKRLVESLDFITREFGNIKVAKVQAEGEFEDSYWLLVHKAIRDHESIYGGGDE